MLGQKDESVHRRGALLFDTYWRPEAVAEDVHIHQSSAYRWERNIAIYGQTTVPRRLFTPGRRPAISPAALDGLLEYQREKPWLYQQELVRYLEEEWETYVDRCTISRALKASKISRKRGQRIGPQSETLRVAWQAFASQVKAEQLVFIDESLFKLQTMWRSMAYAPIGKPPLCLSRSSITYVPIGEPARYQGDMRRGDTYSVLPAYTTEGYLPCTGVKKGWYNTEQIIDWLINELLPLCNEFPRERSIIVLDNVSVHVDPRIVQAIEEKGCMVKYLPPYSPDYNPIELTFSVLKAWMRRYFEAFKPQFEGDFEGFLRYALEHSGCDRFAKEHFKHSDAGYIFDGEIEEFERTMREI